MTDSEGRSLDRRREELKEMGSRGRYYTSIIDLIEETLDPNLEFVCQRDVPSEQTANA